MRGLAALASGVIVAVWSTGLLADDKRDCVERTDHDVRIKSCSAVIDGNPNDAIAYYTRAVSHQLKGDVDKAISDYDQAIALNPYHASAYDGRGRAYASKGDYVKAVADVTRATEPTQGSTPEPKTSASADGPPKEAQRAPEEVKTATAAIPRIAGKEQGLPKNAHQAPNQLKTVTRTRAAEKKASPEAILDGPWPAWAPLAPQN